MAHFGPNDSAKRYRSFVGEGVDQQTEAFYDTDSPGPLLGSSSFIDDLRNHVTYDSEIPQRRVFEQSAAIEEVVAATARAFGISADEVRAHTRKNGAKSVAIYLCRHMAGHTLRDIAAHFGFRSYASVSTTCGKALQLIENNRLMAALVDEPKGRLLR